MKLIIELPADDFNAIYHGGLCDIRHDKLDQAITEAFQYATILPKGHGDLIDRSKLAFFRCPNNVKDCPPSYDFKCNSCDYGITHKFKVDEADVVIPADRGDTE